MTALNAHPAGRYHMDPCSVLATACTLAYQRQPDAAARQLDKLDDEQREAAFLAVDAVRARLLTILDSARQVTG